MRVMVMVKSTRGSEEGGPPDMKMMAEMGKFNEELIKAGVLLAGEGLHPSSRGVRVHFSGDTRTVTDGPFAETKELVAGFWMWRVNSMEEAVEWVKRCPNPHPEDCHIEIRPVFEAEDFGEGFTPELREQEAAQRAQMQGLGEVRFENVSAMVLAGLQKTYNMETRDGIPSQWERFTAMEPQVDGRVGDDTFGVSWGMQPDGSFHYLCGFQVASEQKAPAGFATLSLDPRRYAVFTHNEHVTKIQETFDAIFSRWAPDSGLCLAQAPCVEVYPKEFTMEKGPMEIWVPLAG